MTGIMQRSIQSRTPAHSRELERMVNISRFLSNKARQRFYGRVVLKFERGEIVLITVEETVKPNEIK